MQDSPEKQDVNKFINMTWKRSKPIEADIPASSNPADTKSSNYKADDNVKGKNETSTLFINKNKIRNHWNAEDNSNIENTPPGSTILGQFAYHQKNLCCENTIYPARKPITDYNRDPLNKKPICGDERNLSVRMSKGSVNGEEKHDSVGAQSHLNSKPAFNYKEDFFHKIPRNSCEGRDFYLSDEEIKMWLNAARMPCSCDSDTEFIQSDLNPNITPLTSHEKFRIISPSNMISKIVKPRGVVLNRGRGRGRGRQSDRSECNPKTDNDIKLQKDINGLLNTFDEMRVANLYNETASTVISHAAVRPVMSDMQFIDYQSTIPVKNDSNTASDQRETCTRLDSLVQITSQNEYHSYVDVQSVMPASFNELAPSMKAENISRNANNCEVENEWDSGVFTNIDTPFAGFSQLQAQTLSGPQNQSRDVITSGFDQNVVINENISYQSYRQNVLQNIESPVLSQSGSQDHYSAVTSTGCYQNSIHVPYAKSRVVSNSMGFNKSLDYSVPVSSTTNELSAAQQPQSGTRYSMSLSHSPPGFGLQNSVSENCIHGQSAQSNCVPVFDHDQVTSSVLTTMSGATLNDYCQLRSHLENSAPGGFTQPDYQNCTDYQQNQGPKSITGETSLQNPLHVFVSNNHYEIRAQQSSPENTIEFSQNHKQWSSQDAVHDVSSNNPYQNRTQKLITETSTKFDHHSSQNVVRAAPSNGYYQERAQQPDPERTTEFSHQSQWKAQNEVYAASVNNAYQIRTQQSDSESSTEFSHNWSQWSSRNSVHVDPSNNQYQSRPQVSITESAIGYSHPNSQNVVNDALSNDNHPVRAQSVPNELRQNQYQARFQTTSNYHTSQVKCSQNSIPGEISHRFSRAQVNYRSPDSSNSHFATGFNQGQSQLVHCPDSVSGAIDLGHIRASSFQKTDGVDASNNFSHQPPSSFDQDEERLRLENSGSMTSSAFNQIQNQVLPSLVPPYKFNQEYLVQSQSQKKILPTIDYQVKVNTSINDSYQGISASFQTAFVGQNVEYQLRGSQGDSFTRSDLYQVNDLEQTSYSEECQRQLNKQNNVFQNSASLGENAQKVLNTEQNMFQNPSNLCTNLSRCIIQQFPKVQCYPMDSCSDQVPNLDLQNPYSNEFSGNVSQSQSRGFVQHRINNLRLQHRKANADLVLSGSENEDGEQIVTETNANYPYSNFKQDQIPNCYPNPDYESFINNFDETQSINAHAAPFVMNERHEQSQMNSFMVKSGSSSNTDSNEHESESQVQNFSPLSKHYQEVSATLMNMSRYSNEGRLLHTGNIASYSDRSLGDGNDSMTIQVEDDLSYPNIRAQNSEPVFPIVNSYRNTFPSRNERIVAFTLNKSNVVTDINNNISGILKKSRSKESRIGFCKPTGLNEKKPEETLKKIHIKKVSFRLDTPRT